MKQANYKKGQLGEQLASDFLRKKGYRIIETNFRTRFGEIDIIAKTHPPADSAGRPPLKKGGLSSLVQGENPPAGGEGFRDEVLVFVEVKLKVGTDFGTPEEMITGGKIWQVKQTAEAYLQQNPKIAASFLKYRIDAICIVLNEDYSVKSVRHYENIPN
jgi:putative endonuclease